MPVKFKAIKSTGQVEKDKEYKVELLIPSTQLVKIVDDKDNLLPGGYDPRHVFGKSITELVAAISAI